MGQEYRRTNTTVSLINYHFVFCPRYRRKALVNEVDRRFREILQQVCDEHELTIVALEVMPDHVHLFVNAFGQKLVGGGAIGGGEGNNGAQRACG